MTQYILKHYSKIQQILIKFYISASTCTFASESGLTGLDGIHFETENLKRVWGCPTLELKMADCAWYAQNLAFCLGVSPVLPERGTYNPDSPLLCQFSRSFSTLYALRPMTWVLCFKWGALPCNPLASPRVYGVRVRVRVDTRNSTVNLF